MCDIDTTNCPALYVEMPCRLVVPSGTASGRLVVLLSLENHAFM